MQSIFSNALSRAVAKHIDLSVTRRETLSWLALLIMQHGTICLWRLAAYVASVAQTDSVRRRFYRFFQFVRLDSALAAQARPENVAALPALAHARREMAAQARRAGRARYRNLADLHRGAARLSTRAYRARQRLRSGRPTRHCRTRPTR
jgi:hypothetical protein